MPTYTYRCRDCQHELEKIQKITAPDPVECPECGERKLRKVIGSGNFILKGKGWYVTDFKDKKTDNSKAAETKTPATKTPASTETSQSSSSSGSSD